MNRAMLVVGIFLLLFALGAGGGSEVFFQQKDPLGDDNGPGTYLYPRNVAFEPYEGLFDLIGFSVWREKEEEILFDLQMAKITNPWAAPEGFIHPVIHIYIDSGPGGQILPASSGPDVLFRPEYAWDYCLIAAGWGNSRFLAADEGNGRILQPISAEVLGDRRTIRLRVPVTLLGVPSRRWRYYVLVGSYDGFGPGLFRDIRATESEWFFGGGHDKPGEPRVLDLLAPATGKYTQQQQLRYDPTGKRRVTLTPVGHGLTTGFRWWNLLAWALVLGMIAAGLIWTAAKGKLFVFWLKIKDFPDGRFR